MSAFDDNVSYIEMSHQGGDLMTGVATLHKVLSARYAFIDRIAVAIYDEATDLLKTFVSSNFGNEPLAHYDAKLSDVPSLKLLASNRQKRVVQDIPAAFSASSTHTRWLNDQQYLSSYTVPIFQADRLAAFVFFDSRKSNVFSDEAIRFLDTFAELVSQLYLLELRVVHGLIGTVHIASGIARLRDLETGQHLNRMANYARLIALELAKSRPLTDEFIEYLHLFAPLHDIGKVGIPDAILHKPGKLDDKEWGVMRSHVEIGEGIIDEIGRDMGLQTSLASRIMKNIVACHHERGDGSGYPRHLTMDQIPLEGRIVAVADVYDALSSWRPYKPAWTEEAVFAELRSQSAMGKLDSDCVEALFLAKAGRDRIRAQFSDDFEPR